MSPGIGDTHQISAQRLTAALESDDEPGSYEEESDLAHPETTRIAPRGWSPAAIALLAVLILGLSMGGMGIAYLIGQKATHVAKPVLSPPIAKETGKQTGSLPMAHVLPKSSPGKSDSENLHSEAISEISKNSQSNFHDPVPSKQSNQSAANPFDAQSDISNIFGAKFVSPGARFPANWKTLTFSFDTPGPAATFPIGGNQMVSGTIESSFVSPKGSLCRQADLELVGKEVTRTILGCRSEGQSWDQADILVLSK